MAKKDENGRVVIPKEIYKQVGIIFSDMKNFKPYFFFNCLGEVGVTIDVGRDFPREYRHLGYCDFNEEDHSIYIPENVECAVGSKELFFTVDKNPTFPILYINSTNSKIYKAISYIEAWLNEDIDD